MRRRARTPGSDGSKSSDALGAVENLSALVDRHRRVIETRHEELVEIRRKQSAEVRGIAQRLDEARDVVAARPSKTSTRTASGRDASRSTRRRCACVSKVWSRHCAATTTSSPPRRRPPSSRQLPEGI